MNKKKLLLSLLAVALICTIAITGTLAFLTNTTIGIKNTFVSAGDGLIDDPVEPDPTPDDDYDDNGFYLLENGVTQNDDGSYTIDDETIYDSGAANNYSVLPGTTLPKNPFVRILGKNEIPAYLFIEVVDTLGENSGLTYALASCWVDTGLTGKNGGDVYVYTASEAAVILTSDPGDIAIIDGNVITAGDTLTIPENAELSFYSYLAQASAGEDAASAFTACFG